MKASLYPEAERVSVAGTDAFYAYCALTLYGTLAVANKVKTALWDHFDASPDMRLWAPTINSSVYRGTGQFPPVDVLVTLTVRVYNMDIRIYSPRYENGYRDYPSLAPPSATGVRNGNQREKTCMTLDLGDCGELYLLVKHDTQTGKNKIPATVINVLVPQSAAIATARQKQQQQQQQESPFSLAVYDSQSRTHMKIDARFIPPRGDDRAHYMNFDLDLSGIKAGWQFILKGCDSVPVFIFAMRTHGGVRHASYIAHWPVAMVEPYITLSKQQGDDGLIVVPTESNRLEDAKRCVVSELKCVIDA